MSVSSPFTWDGTPGYKIEKGGVDAVSRRLNNGVERVRQAGETPASGRFGYSEGSPQVNPDVKFSPQTTRMAGDKLIDKGLLAGEFAEKIGEEGPLREGMGEWMAQLNNGIFGFGPPMDAPPEETA